MIIKSITNFYQRIRPHRSKRIEILLPLEYNDGTPIERQKFALTIEELTEQFGGVTSDPSPKSGRWKDAGKIYTDNLIRVTIDTKDAKAEAFLREYKPLLKERFRQLEMHFTIQKIEIL